MSNAEVVKSDLAQAAQALESADVNKIGIKELALLILAYKLSAAKAEYRQKIAVWQERRTRIQEYTTAMQLINAKTQQGTLELEKADTVSRKADGTIDLTDAANKHNLRAHLEKLQQDGCDIAVKDKYEKEDTPRLNDSLNYNLSDLNVHNNMTVEEINQVVTMRFELYHYLRSITKSLHEATQQAARSMGGR